MIDILTWVCQSIALAASVLVLIEINVNHRSM